VRRSTKIVNTIGPTCSTREILSQMLDAGMNVARLNFSHGTHEAHSVTIRMLRELAAEKDRPLAILQDLQGPKIRIGALRGAQPVELRPGQRFIITTEPLDEGTAEIVGTTYSALAHDCKPGDRVLLQDGTIELRVLSTTAKEVITQVVNGGMLRQKVGINLPGVRVSTPALTEKDIEDLRFGLEHDVDWIALSFVRRAADVHVCKNLIAAAGKQTPVIAKIEKPEALTEIDQIIEAADGIMVARGDLGVELPLDQVPVVQKKLIAACNRAGKPVITATQMIESMTHEPRPTRAEVSDVANAILDGTDAVMTSAETANGQYPVEAVRWMDIIATTTEASDLPRADTARTLKRIDEADDLAGAISAAACAIVDALDVRAVVAFTMSGRTAQQVARLRPAVPIYALTPNVHTYQRLSLVWGVTPVLCGMFDRLDDLSDHVCHECVAHGIASPGDMVVMTGGHPIAMQGSTNFLKVIQIPPA
jgi:pyruvate kinase